VSIPQLLLVPAETCANWTLDDGLPTVAILPQHEMAPLASIAQTWSEPALIDTKDLFGTSSVGTDTDGVVSGCPI
jgi:hypothetical protein